MHRGYSSNKVPHAGGCTASRRSPEEVRILPISVGTDPAHDDYQKMDGRFEESEAKALNKEKDKDRP
jgi:hypothetical protein